ncbi:hypothetical protein AVEN_235739-1 [Araneus ventricosus]|uniref:Uncharacterized protein n=1 Tax=Araneus ventricosus TaxID=182803 RepID=A0A4Y2ETY7_ARAVE|nr:hypothetical protein AVEN_235739-1 [Araneus ventricosus]
MRRPAATPASTSCECLLYVGTDFLRRLANAATVSASTFMTTANAANVASPTSTMIPECRNCGGTGPQRVVIEVLQTLLLRSFVKT